MPELLRTKSPQPGVQRAREDYPGHRKGGERVAGPGFVGPCLPKDTAALSQIVREHECRTRLVEAVVEVNEQQKHRMVQKILGALHTSSNGGSLQKSP